MEIENFGRRDKIWFHPTLRVRLDATPEQVRYLIRELKAVLLSQPKVDPEGARVRLIAVGQYSLDLEVFCYVLTSSYDEYLPIQEEMLLAFLDVIQASGTSLALPAQEAVLVRGGSKRGVPS